MGRGSQLVTIIRPDFVESRFGGRNDVYGVAGPQITRRRQFAGHKFHPVQQLAGERYQVPDLVLDVFEEKTPQFSGLGGAQRSFAEITVKYTGDLSDTERRRA